MQEIKECQKTVLTVDNIATVCGISPERITAQARDAPEKLGFPVIVACDTVRIPRKPFIRWFEEEVAK